MEDDRPYITEIITDPEFLKLKPDTDGTKPTYPVRIQKHGNETHKTETRIFAREIHESYCDEPSCEFYGKHASQGHCWIASDLTELRLDKAIDRAEEEAKEAIAELDSFRPESDKEYIAELKSHLICEYLNDSMQWEEQLRLRMENAKLRLKLGIYK